MFQIPQTTARRVTLKVYLTGTTTPATGKTLAVVLSKTGAAFANPAAGATAATELSDGWYFVDLAAGDTNTLGDLIVRGTATGCDASERLFGVVKATTGGLTALPDAAAEAAGGLYTRGTGAGQLAQTAAGELGVATLAKTVTTLTNLPAAPADWLTAAAVADGAIDAATFAADCAAEVRAWVVNGGATLDGLQLNLLATRDPGALLATGGQVAAVNTNVSNLTTLTAGRASQESVDALAAVVDALPTAAESAAGLLDLADGVEVGLTPRQALRVVAAALAGQLAGAATTTVTIQAAGAPGTTRITATVTPDGDRTAVTLTP